MRRLLAATITILAMLVATGVAWSLASPAQAASCTKKTGTAKTDPDGNSWTTWWVCGNDKGAPMYREPKKGTLTGYMDSTSSWFVCWRRGDLHAGGNNVWYYSQGDRTASGQSARHAWGFMPAVNVWTSVDPWTGMAQCPSTTLPPTTTPPPTTTTSTIPSPTSGIKRTLLIHGYGFRNDTVDCADYWGPGKTYLESHGFQGKVVSFGLYRDAPNCTVKLSDHTHGPTPSNLGLRDESISELASDLAWYIYNTYSKNGEVVDAITHSMGGLVMRVAIAGTKNRTITPPSGDAWPPFIYVEDVATLSAPYEGAGGIAQAGCALQTTVQCQQLTPGSTFQTTWITPSSDRAAWDNPQSRMTTDWSAIGINGGLSGDGDAIVSAQSALNLSASVHFAHKYVYGGGQGLGHSNSTDIVGGSYSVRYCDKVYGCNPASWTNWTETTMPGPMFVASMAVQNSNW